jgi:choline-glycine betaine transporter
MSLKPPFTELEIAKETSGFYEGNSLPIALISKISMTALVLWALIAPGNASNALSAINGTLLNSFNSFYIIAVGLFAFFLFLLAILPATGTKRLGGPETSSQNFPIFPGFP